MLCLNIRQVSSWNPEIYKFGICVFTWISLLFQVPFCTVFSLVIVYTYVRINVYARVHTHTHIHTNTRNIYIWK